MADKDKPVADKPAADTKTVVKPKVEEPVSGAAEPAGSDQFGRQLYSVNCASCGKPAQVPFKPSGDKPVYCRDCYMQQRRGRMGMGDGMRRGPRR